MAREKKIRGSKAAREGAHVHAAIIESDNKKQRVYNFHSMTKQDEWRQGKCLLCGMDFDVLTLHHAQSHGFKSKEEMLAAGVVRHFYTNEI